jgi:hypothetical protein
VTKIGELERTLAVTNDWSTLRWKVTANVVRTSQSLVTLMLEEKRFPKSLSLQEPHGVTSQ